MSVFCKRHWSWLCAVGQGECAEMTTDDYSTIVAGCLKDKDFDGAVAVLRICAVHHPAHAELLLETVTVGLFASGKARANGSVRRGR